VVATARASPPPVEAVSSAAFSAAFSAGAEEDLALLAKFLAKVEVEALENNMVEFAKDDVGEGIILCGQVIFFKRNTRQI
jgi:hypothetical protein